MIKSTGKLMNARKEVKAILIAQKGTFYNYNFNNLRSIGYNGTDIQNAYDYFKYSPQQLKFRKENYMN